MKKLRANKPQVLLPVFPNEGVRAWYEKQLDDLIDESGRELITAVTRAWQKTPPLFGSGHITMAYGDSELPATHAGVLITSGKLLLLMHRRDGQGWAFPGGGIEENETAEVAARREVFEELLVPINGPLTFSHVQIFRNVRFATFTYDVLEPFIPSLIVEHDDFRWVTVENALEMDLHPGVRATLLQRPQFAMDAPSPTKALQTAMARWGTQTIKRFDLMAETIAENFARKNQEATQAAMMAQLKRAGFTVPFKPTLESIEAYRVTVAENVGLIKSIPRKFHANVETRVWEAVRNGSDLATLSKQLRKEFGSTRKRAALIARDQNAKAKATIERVRQLDLGITRAIWMHSSAGKEPRPTHVSMNGKPYSIVKGFYDRDENEWVHPGQLINCRCTMRPIIEGFEE